jgi:two-component system NtrC family response regulator
VPLHVPSLRERREDIPLLAREFVKKHALQVKIDFDNQLLEALMEYQWPGNVRELENLIARMVILRQGDTLSKADLPDDFGLFDPHGDPNDSSDLRDQHQQVTFEEAERDLIIDALVKSGWNKTKAAKRLDIPRHVLIYRLKKYDISEPGED